jgi:HK97 family phage major capsid protein
LVGDTPVPLELILTPAIRESPVNPYLAKQREKYDALRTSIEGLQTRAAEQNRGLSEDELRSVNEQIETSKKLFAEIESLTDVETRNRKTAEMAAAVAGDGNEQTRSTSSTTAKDRDPGHYRSAKEGGRRSFFADLHSSKQGDNAAAQRLSEHTRALTSVDEGPGTTPPKWMTSEWSEIRSQSRRVASAVRNAALPDPAPMSLPRQTARAGTLAEQTTEESSTDFTDGWDSTAVTVTPKMTAGGQKVTRVMLDASTPAIDQLIWADLLADYDSAVEAKVVAAMVTAAGSATVTYATEATYNTGLDPAEATYIGDAILDTAIAVRNANKLPADILVSSVTRWGSLLKIRDSLGRPLIVAPENGPSNAIGSGQVANDGRVYGLSILATDGITQYPESILVARADDTVLFESPTVRFKYEEPDGPEIIRLGIYAYTAVYVKYTSSVERIAITAAA